MTLLPTPTVLLQRVWASIRQPRHMKVIYLGVYIITAMIGTGALVAPPPTIAGALGPTLTVLWAVFLIAGGLAGSGTVLHGVWWLERLALLAIATGLLIYAIVVLTLHPITPAARIPQLGFLLIAGAVYLIRYLAIRHYTFEPRG